MVILFPDMALTDEEFKKIFPFPEARNGQRETIEKILDAFNSGKKYVVLSAPTGIGKSCIGLTVSNSMGGSYILTSQKSLQQQYYDTLFIPFVLGRSNYACKKMPDRTCDIGKCIGKKAKPCKDCEYANAKEQCLNSTNSGLNYAYFINLAGNPGQLAKRPLVICDEAHNLEDEILKTFTPRIDAFTLLNTGLGKNESDFPTEGTELEWLCNTLVPKLDSELKFTKSQLSAMKGVKSSSAKKLAKRFAWLKDLHCKASSAGDIYMSGDDVIVSRNDTSITFRPLRAKGIFSKIFNECGEKFLFMSATIVNPESFLMDLGIPIEETEIIERDSPFPVENHPIYYSPAGSMSFKTKYDTYPILVKKVLKIMDIYPKSKGIIHTVNYEVANKIMNAARLSGKSGRLIMPTGANRQSMIDEFYRSTEPLVLISPSLQEGIDLKDDLARFCIICKVPYSSLGDEWVSRRMKENQSWYMTRACSSLVQMTGRCVRTETDHADSYILDKDFETLLKKGGFNILPKWWISSIQERNV